MKQYWFKRRMYGWGWYPSSWQGWSSIAVYLVALVAAIYHSNSVTNNTTAQFNTLFPEMFFYTVILSIICFKTGEQPKWQWGEKRKNTN